MNKAAICLYCICGLLFNYAVSSSLYGVEWSVGNELERMWNNLRYYFGVVGGSEWGKALKVCQKNSSLRVEIRTPNTGNPEYEAGVLIAWQRYIV